MRDNYQTDDKKSSESSRSPRFFFFHFFNGTHRPFSKTLHPLFERYKFSMIFREKNVHFR